MTFISFARMMEVHRDRPLTISLEALRNLPEDLWQAVMTEVAVNSRIEQPVAQCAPPFLTVKTILMEVNDVNQSIDFDRSGFAGSGT